VASARPLERKREERGGGQRRDGEVPRNRLKVQARGGRQERGTADISDSARKKGPHFFLVEPWEQQGGGRRRKKGRGTMVLQLRSSERARSLM